MKIALSEKARKRKREWKILRKRTKRPHTLNSARLMINSFCRSLIVNLIRLLSRFIMKKRRNRMIR